MGLTGTGTVGPLVATGLTVCCVGPPAEATTSPASLPPSATDIRALSLYLGTRTDHQGPHVNIYNNQKISFSSPQLSVPVLGIASLRSAHLVDGSLTTLVTS